MRWLLLLLVVACALLACAELHAAFDFDLNELPPEADADDSEAAEELIKVNEPPARPFNPILQPFSAGRLNFFGSAPPPVIGYSKKAEVNKQPDDQPSKRRKLRDSSSEQEQTKSQSRGLFSSVWTKVRSLPAYFDFDSFSRKFKRHYKTGETFLRRSIFLQKCLSIFKSRLASRLGQKSYIEDVNKFTDRTPEELKLMYMPAPPAGLKSTSGLSRAQLDRLYRQRLEQIERLNDENYRPELESRCSLGDESSTTSGGLLNEQQTKQLIDELYKSELDNQSFESAILNELSGHQIETESRADLSQLAGAELPWPGQLSSPEGSELVEENEPYEYPHLDPSEALDWSRHGCFHEIYDQGKNCGSCYVMATTTLAEFYKCSEEVGQIKKRKFSKEFVLNCGQKYSPTLMGCAGGSPLETLRFIAHSGIYNIRDWRQKRVSELKVLMEVAGGSQILDKLDMLCPLQASPRTPTHEWGNTRVLLNPRPVPPSRWKEALQDGPLVANLQMPSVGVDSYSSGVHDGEGCATSGAWHAMLLVGYGVSERGQPYWRFRNSFGRDWGVAGHFHLSMKVPGACLLDGVRVYREQLSS